MSRARRAFATHCLARICVALAVLAGVTYAGPRSLAAEGDPARQERAIATFERGQAQFRANRYDAAAGLFKEAYETWPDPAYLYNVAFAFEKGERWRLAVLWYDRFLARHGDTPNAPEVRARREAAAASREATLADVMVTSEPAGARAETVGAGDDALAATEPAPSCVTPCVLRVDPGAVVVRVALGARKVDTPKSLAANERWDLAVTLPSASHDGGADRTPSIVAWSAGGAALVVGVVFAILAQSSFDSGKALAARGPLDARDQQRLAGLRGDVEERSLASDIGFGGALVGAAVGTVLWLTTDEHAR